MLARSIVRRSSATTTTSARAIAKIEELNTGKIWNVPIVTQIASLDAFYPAEDYHQGYFRSHPAQGYCQAVISPKVGKFRLKFAHRLRG